MKDDRIFDIIIISIISLFVVLWLSFWTYEFILYKKHKNNPIIVKTKTMVVRHGIIREIKISNEDTIITPIDTVLLDIKILKQ